MEIKIEEWIVRMLLAYGNTSLPLKLCKEHNLNDIEDILTEKCGCPVKIRISRNKHDNCFCSGDTRLFTDTFYIAEMDKS